MSSKAKFRPVVTRVKLNPEQAVLACGCWDTSSYGSRHSKKAGTVCVLNSRTLRATCVATATNTTS